MSCGNQEVSVPRSAISLNGLDWMNAGSERDRARATVE